MGSVGKRDKNECVFQGKHILPQYISVLFKFNILLLDIGYLILCTNRDKVIAKGASKDLIFLSLIHLVWLLPLT